MKNFASTLLFVALLSMVFACLAGAQATRTWVSGVGDDANPCSRTAPCKDFAGAISKTAIGGEINCLDPGGFGAVTITKAITIDCGLNGNTGGSILAAGTLGINIALGTGVGTVVTIRNLTINGYGSGTSPGTTGITVSAAPTLHLENVKVFGFGTSCLNVGISAATQVSIANSTFSDCGPTGISFAGAGGTVEATLDNVRVWNAGTTTTGIQVGALSRIVVRHSDVSFANVGVTTFGTNGSGAVVADSILSFNGTALAGSTGSPVVASKNVFSNNNLVYGGTGLKTTSDNIGIQNTLTGVATVISAI